jgi:aminomethyltransferase
MSSSHCPQEAGLRHSAVHALALELGARIVPFAGFELPVQFPPGIIHEHLHARAHAALFDISHMGQIEVTGPDAARRLEALVPGDITGLAPWQQRYTLLTNDAGGIVDDLMVTRLPDRLWLVVNGACRDKDRAWLADRLGGDGDLRLHPDRALLALQGPESARALAALCPGAAQLPFMHGGEFMLAGLPALIHRCGYTGEDGFEISLPAAGAEAVARALLAQPGVAPAGLGARDSLRLEAGLCLYGNDIDEHTSPVEAGLAWTIARKYRDGSATAAFPGAVRILAQLHDPGVRRRVGLRPDGPAPVRAGAAILDAAGAAVGIITSGGYGPSVGAPVAMGYVEARCAAPGTALRTEVRGRSRSLTVCALPFVPHRYFKPGMYRSGPQ